MDYLRMARALSFGYADTGLIRSIMDDLYDQADEYRTQGFKLKGAPVRHCASKVIYKKEPFKRMHRRMNMR